MQESSNRDSAVSANNRYHVVRTTEREGSR